MTELGGLLNRCTNPRCIDGRVQIDVGSWGACTRCKGSGIEPIDPEDEELSNPSINKLPGSRKGARSTSKRAALHHYPRSGSARLRVLEAFAELDPIGMTHEELTEMLSPKNLGLSTFRSRASELEDGGWLEDSGERRPSRANEPITVWRLTDKARTELLKHGWVPRETAGQEG